MISLSFSFFPPDISHFQEQNDLKGLLENLHQNIQAKKRKNVEIMWLAATVSALQPDLCSCDHHDRQTSLSSCCVGSHLCTLGYQMSLSVIQGFRHFQCCWQFYQYTRTQDGRRCTQRERVLPVRFLVDPGCCLTL